MKRAIIENFHLRLLGFEQAKQNRKTRSSLDQDFLPTTAVSQQTKKNRNLSRGRRRHCPPLTDNRSKSRRRRGSQLLTKGFLSAPTSSAMA
jgi:hypothetical protein